MTELLRTATQYVEYIPKGLLVCVFMVLWKIDKNIGTRTTKTYADETFQRKDIADERNERIEKRLDEIGTDVKTLLSK